MTTLKIAYAGSASFTITLTALATDTNLLAGRQTTVVDNTTTLADDVYIEGIITTGTSTANTVVEVWAFGSVDAGTTYTAGAGASDAALSPATLGVKNLMSLITVINQTDTTGRAYNWGPVSLLSVFNNVMPDHFGLYFVHNTGANLGTSSAKYNTVTWTSA